MIWNTIPDNEKLQLWKKLRADIADLPLNEKLEQIATFCSKIPFGTRTLDYYSSENWPTPWEILFYSSFCTSSISLLIFYTIMLLPEPPEVELILVEDNDIYLLPIINGQYILNYELGKVNNSVDICTNFKIVQKYTKAQVKNIK